MKISCISQTGIYGEILKLIIITPIYMSHHLFHFYSDFTTLCSFVDKYFI